MNDLEALRRRYSPPECPAGHGPMQWCDVPGAGFDHYRCAACDLRDLRQKPYAPHLDVLAIIDEVEHLRALVNRPLIHDFGQAVIAEAAHQVERWGVDHDAGKGPEDWFWLLGYLGGKALRAAVAGDIDKARHHCISTAAALANWHAQLSALVPHPCETTPVGAQEESAGERQPTPDHPRDPRHITAESERVPSHEDIDRHPRPVEMVERVLGLKWRASDICLGSYFLDRHWSTPWAASHAGGWWTVTSVNQEGVESCVAEGPGEDRPAASRAALHAYLEGRLTPPDGAPGWGAWEWV